MGDQNFVIGIDYGTDSVRAILADTGNGNEISNAVFYYPRWREGLYSDPSKNQFRQHPLDYLEGLEFVVKKIVTEADVSIENIKGIGIDTTGSTPVAVDNKGVPLSLKEEFKENPHAMFILWKDHTAVDEAEEINQISRTWGGIDFTKYEGGVYSSEWFWAKIIHTIRVDKRIYEKAYSWVEHCDWIPALITGNSDPISMKRSRCAAGHKAMWHTEWGGLPDEEFLIKIEPKLKGLKKRLYSETYTSDLPAGFLSEEWAERLGLKSGIPVTVGTFDAHSGALGGEVKEFTLSKVMGTSTCDMLVAPMAQFGEKLVGGICGQVDGSIIPGMLGLEAGQSAFGDIYAWFTNLLYHPTEVLLGDTELIDSKTTVKLKEEIKDNLIKHLSTEAAKIPIGETDIVALDWMNGRRTPYANQALKGVISGLNLGSDAPRIFRALVEATCFGSKKIVDRFREEGIEIKNVVALGGVAKKSNFVMQVMADVLNMTIQVARSEQTPALGTAMLAATAAGIYATSEEAQHAMGNGMDKEYFPVLENVSKYEKLYQKYSRLGELIESQLESNGQI
jgi:L-ribulokinase